MGEEIWQSHNYDLVGETLVALQHQRKRLLGTVVQHQTRSPHIHDIELLLEKPMGPVLSVIIEICLMSTEGMVAPWEFSACSAQRAGAKW